MWYGSNKRIAITNKIFLNEKELDQSRKEVARADNVLCLLSKTIEY